MVTSLHAGLVPLISYESGVDIGTSGTLLKTCSISEIREAIMMQAEKPLSQQKDQAGEAWELAQRHTCERYAEVYRALIAGRSGGG